MTVTDTTRAGMKKQAPPAAPAISPAIGSLPPISVPRLGEVGSTGLLWHAKAQAARCAGGWAAHHPRQHDQARRPRQACPGEQDRLVRAGQQAGRPGDGCGQGAGLLSSGAMMASQGPGSGQGASDRLQAISM